MVQKDLVVPVLSKKTTERWVRAQHITEVNLRKAAKLVAESGIQVLQSDVRLRITGRHARLTVTATLDGAYGIVGPRQLCVEDRRPRGTQDEIELIAWVMAWTYGYCTTQRQEED